MLNRTFFSGLCFLLATMTSAAQSNIVTYQYDNARTGQNTNETTLTPSNVNVNHFGKLFSVPIDGQVYAEPLYVPGVAISGKGTHNVLIVATENDSVYAFDADVSASPLWQVSLVDAAHGATNGETALNTGATIGCTDLQPAIGITSTPVIDSSSGTIYVEAKSVSGSNYFHRLHALDITSGNEKSPGPVQIKATVNGTGDGSTNNQLVFDSNTMALHHLNRPALLLMNGTIFLGFASHCDFSPYHGWLFAYDAATLTQKAVFVVTPNGAQGGVWMSGAGLAGDANGNIYPATGNGTFSQGTPLELGDSILKLNFNGSSLSLADYFTPFNQNGLNSGDTDLGSGGVLLLPDQPGSHPHLLVQAGKEGRIYLIDRDKMTANPANPSQEEPFCSGCSSDPQIVQESGPGQVGGMWSVPAYWNNTTYWWGSGDFLKSIPLSNGLLDFTHITSSTGSYGFPGATPSISANGASNGIVWSIDSSQYGSPGPGPGPAVLHAHDATNVARELWNSTQAANNRDRAGNAVKFSVPRIANGKVYVGTSSEVDVYGLLPQAAIPSIRPASGTYTNSVSVTLTDATANATITYTTDGSTPVPGSHGTAVFSGASFTLTSSATVQAIASASGFSNSSVASATYTLTAQAPAITSGSSTTFTVGTAGSFTVTATGSPTPSITESGALPGGVTFKDNGNGTATLSGTPASGTAGTYTLTLTASNGVGTAATQTFTLTVNGGAGGGGIKLVQHTSIDAGITNSSALGFLVNNTAGDWIVVCIRAGAMNEAFTVTDTRGNTYHKAVQYSETGDGNTIGIFYAENIAGGGNTVTVSDSIAETLRFAILEYSGVATSGSLDVVVVTQGSSASPNSGNATTTANGELLLGVVITGNPETFTAGGGYRVEESVPGEPGTKCMVEDQLQGTAGVATASATLGGTDFWAAVLVAFKAGP